MKYGTQIILDEELEKETKIHIILFKMYSY